MSFSAADLGGTSDTQQSAPQQQAAPQGVAPAAAPAGNGTFSAQDLGGTPTTQAPTTSTAPPESITDRWKRQAYEAVGSMLPQSTVGPTMQAVNKGLVTNLNKMGTEGGTLAEHTMADLSGKWQAEEDEENGKKENIPAYAKGFENLYRRQQAEEAHPVTSGVGEGLSNLGGQIAADPRNWPFIAKGLLKSVGSVAASELAPWAEKLMSKGFGLQMTEGAASQLSELSDNWHTMNAHDKAKAVSQLIAGTYFAQSAMREGFKGEAAPETAPAETGTKLGEETTLRPSTVTTAGVEAPVSAKQRATLAGEKPSLVNRGIEAAAMVTPNAEKKFNEKYVTPAATRQAVSTVGQVVEDSSAKHLALVNGEAEPETIAGTQNPSKHEDLDSMWQEMQNTAQNTTFKKADAISNRETQAWEAKKAAAVAEYKGFVDQHNDLVDRYNSQLSEGEAPQQRADFNPEDVAVPEKPQTYNELRAEVQRQQALTGPTSPADVRDEAMNKGLPQAEKAMDSFFKQHSDEISNAEYDSAKKLWADSMRVKDMSMQLRGPLTQGNLTGRAMRNVEVQMNNKQLRRGQAPDAFRRLMGTEGYENWQNVAKLFDTVKDPSLPEQFKSWGKYAAEYAAAALIPGMHVLGAAGAAAKFGVEQILNHTMFDPEFGSTFNKLTDWLKQSSIGGAVANISSMPAAIKDKFLGLLKGYKDSKLGSERGAAGAQVSQGNTPETNKFGRQGLGGAQAFDASDLTGKSPEDEQAAAAHEANDDSVKVKPEPVKGVSQPNRHGENMEYKKDDTGTTNMQHTVTTTDANGNKIGELAAQDTAPKQVTVRSNQIYDPKLQGAGRGSEQLSHLLSSVPEDTEKVKSDISTTVAARGAWEKLLKQSPEAVTKKVYKGGQVQYTVDMDKWRTGPSLGDNAAETPGYNPQSEISTRSISSGSEKNGTYKQEPSNPNDVTGWKAIEQAEAQKPGHIANLLDKISKYPDLGVKLDPEDMANPRQGLEKVVNQWSNNLKWLHDQIPESIRGISKKWYDSANQMANKWANQYGVQPEKVAGVIAALSPKNPWDINAGQGKRMVDMYQNMRDHAWTPEMDKVLEKIRDTQEDKIDKKTGKNIGNSFRDKLEALRGKKFADLEDPNDPKATNFDQALWMRILDQAHGNPMTELYAPDGSVRGHMKMQWGMPDPMAKALEMLKSDGTPASIHRIIGDGHKIRNFYNNIISPNSPNGHATIDTHAGNADMLVPRGSMDPEVTSIFGGAPTHGATGQQGTYSVHHEAYRRAAEARGILPREMQSITWEGVKSLMGDDKKTPALKKAVSEVWKRHMAGELTLDEARASIVKASGGFTRPPWMTGEPNGTGNSNAGSNEASTSTPDAGKLPPLGVPGEPAVQTGRGTGSRVARPVSEGTGTAASEGVYDKIRNAVKGVKRTKK
jgi:hypothetical protein